MDVGSGALFSANMAAASGSVPYGVEITNRVFVGGCPYNMTELEMTQFFSKFGEVKDAKIITDRDGGKSKGYGFVTFATEEQAAAVYSKGSLYYQQKKLNVAKAIRKYGGQYQKANQEYVNGQRLVYLHPNGYLMTQQQEGWQMEQLTSHTQPVKPYYSLFPPPTPATPGLCYAPMSYMHPATPQLPMYSGYGNPYGYADPAPFTPSYLDEQAVSIISTTAASSGHASLESSGSSHMTPPTGQGVEEGTGHILDMTALEEKTKQLSLMDSAYTSEADLDSSHSTTAANSGTTSPKEPCDLSHDIIQESHDSGNSAQSTSSSPRQTHRQESNQTQDNTVIKVTG